MGRGGQTRARRLAAISAALMLLAMPVWPAAAINYGHGTYGACEYGSCSITISSGNNLSVNVTPSPTGSCSIQKDDVGVFTDNSAGFTLTVANTSTNTSLQKGGNSITTAAATQSSPATLPVNRWGYRVDSVGGFGSGPTSAQTNVSSSPLLFAGVPASNTTADTIANTSTAADPTVTTHVWYGVCADTSITNGTYTTQVLYTTVAN